MLTETDPFLAVLHLNAGSSEGWESGLQQLFGRRVNTGICAQGHAWQSVALAKRKNFNSDLVCLGLLEHPHTRPRRAARHVSHWES